MKPAVEWNPGVLLQQTCFFPVHHIIRQLPVNTFPGLAEWNGLLNKQTPIHVQNGAPLNFVAQSQGKAGFESQYEPRCYLQGEVQTREQNWHDCFNAMVWLTFPAAKAAINMRHFRALTEESQPEPAGSQRGKVRDMVTLLDESGVIVPCSQPGMADLLRSFSWKELFWQRRAELAQAMDFYIIGHGLYEKFLEPYIGLTGQGLIVMVEEEFFSWPLKMRLAFLDRKVADYLAEPAHCLHTRELQPVPLLGVPGWDAMNQQEIYYDNTRYFRPGRGS